MKLPTCWNCDYQFKWLELMFIFGWKRKCPNCQKTQYVTTESVKKTYYLYVPTMIVTLIVLMLPVSFLVKSLILLVVLVLILLPMPYLLKFTDHQQPLF